MLCSACGCIFVKKLTRLFVSKYATTGFRCLTVTNMNLNEKKSSKWVHLLYDDNVESNLRITKLRNQLKSALTTKRSAEKGDLMPYVIAQDLVSFYDSLAVSDEKAKFFNLLSSKLGTDKDSISENIVKLQSALDKDKEAITYKYEFDLMNSLIPAYDYLFKDISKLQNGVEFLVGMRKDLLALYRRKSLQRTPSLLAFDTYLKEHLTLWFWNGFLDLNRISWERSSGETLQKVVLYEAVHPISSWNDLQLRAGPGRRIFAFTHRLMPSEPIVILHTLLSNEVPNNIQTVINRPDEQDYENNKELVTSAVFYSISSTQRGLDGISIGSFLIKRVVEVLRDEFYNIDTFVTLSPIPGFRKWLEFHFRGLEKSAELSPLFCGLDFDIHEIKDTLSSDNWQNDEKLREEIRTPLMQICARYLLSETRRGFTLNPVAHFHLRNGASLWRINWLANTNDYGIKASYGLMVNYKYDLTQIEENNRNYIMEGKIACSDQVKALIV